MFRLDLLGRRLHARFLELANAKRPDHVFPKIGRPLAAQIGPTQAPKPAADEAARTGPNGSAAEGQPRIRHALELPPIHIRDYGKVRIRTVKPTPWGARDIILTYDDLCEHAAASGGAGAGKTASFMDAIAEGLYQASHIPFGPKRDELKFGGLFIESKGDYYAKNLLLCAKYGRLNDLILFGPDHDHVFDVFGDPTEDIAQKVDKMLVMYKAFAPQKGIEDPFWENAPRKLFTNIFALHERVKLRALQSKNQEEAQSFAVPPLSFEYLNLLLLDKGRPINEERLEAQRKAVDDIWTRNESLVSSLRVQLSEFRDLIIDVHEQLPTLSNKLKRQSAVFSATNKISQSGPAEEQVSAACERASATQETKKLAKAIDRFSTHVFSIGRDSSSEPGGHSIDLVTAIDLALRTITAWINQTTAKRLDAWDDVVGKLLTPHRRMLDASLYTTFAFLDRQLAGIELDRKAAQVRELCEDIETLSASIQELSQTLEEPEIGELRKLLDRYERILKEQGSNRLTDSITAYFYGEYLNVANDKTAGSVAMVAGTMIMMFTQSPFDRMFAPGGTFNFNEVLDAGKIVYLDMPTAQYKVKQTIAAIALKLDFFRTMLMRPRARVLLPDGTLGKRLVNQTRFMTYFSDEFGNVATTGVGTGEASCMQEVREWRCGFILGYQSLTVLLQRLPKNEVDSQLTNTRTEVFLNNADEETGKHAAAKLGKKYRVQFNVHKGAGSMFGEQRIGERPYSTSYSYQHRFDPAALADLKKGEAILALPQRFNRHRVFKAQLSNAKIVVSDQLASEIRALVPPAKRRTPT